MTLRCIANAVAPTVAVLLGAGCAFDEHRAALRADFAAGQFEPAYVALHDPENVKLYGEKNELLLRLDQGATALSTGRREQAVATLNEAERLMDARREESIDETLAVFLLNDQQRPYIAEPFEEIYVNVLKMLAQLEAGNIQGGATVEARRMAQKTNVLRDQYLTLEPRVRKAADLPPADNALAPVASLVAVNEQGEFIESTLGLFLSAVAFMQAGDANDQAVAARRLQQAIESQQGLIGDVDPRPFEDLADLAPRSVNAMVVALSGRGPTKQAFHLPPLVIYQTPIYTELPVLKWAPSEVAQARVVVRDPGSSGEGVVAADLHYVENMASVANENHKRELPLIYFRTIARAAAKSVGLTIAANAASRSAHDDAAGFAVALGGLALLLITEKADLRCWIFLPGEARVGLLSLAPGAHEVRVEYISQAGGVVYATPWRSIDAKPDGFTTVVTQYWR